MATTYTLIDKSILGSNQASVSFTGLGAFSSTYTDLKLVASVRDTSASNYQNAKLTFNSSTSGYSEIALRAYGGSTVDSVSASGSSINLFYETSDSATANTFGTYEIYIPNFSSSNNKSVSIDCVTENNASDAFLGLVAGLWANTAAITSITVAPLSGAANLKTNSSFYLYGIKNS
jgi:hypothetical protein